MPELPFLRGLSSLPLRLSTRLHCWDAALGESSACTIMSKRPNCSRRRQGYLALYKYHVGSCWGFYGPIPLSIRLVKTNTTTTTKTETIAATRHRLAQNELRGRRSKLPFEFLPHSICPQPFTSAMTSLSAAERERHSCYHHYQFFRGRRLRGQDSSILSSHRVAVTSIGPPRHLVGCALVSLAYCGRSTLSQCPRHFKHLVILRALLRLIPFLLQRLISLTQSARPITTLHSTEKPKTLWNGS